MTSDPEPTGSPSPSPPSPSSPRPVRWWPGALVALVTIGALVRLHLGESVDHQQQFLQSVVICALGGLGLLLWLLLLSRLPGRTRLKILGAVVLGGIVFGGLFRIKGVSGNLVPILEFRWAGEGAYEEVRGRAAVETSPYDFPQFLGQSRDGVVRGVRLARDWQAEPPRELWRREVGDAWSGFAVVGDAAVTLEQKGDTEVLSRYDLETGEPVWTHGIPAHFESVIGGNGPRSTPTVHRGRVYAFGPLGDLRAVDLASGELIWHRSLQEDHGAVPPEWGFASSPLVVERPDGEGELVVVSIGRKEGKSLVAHDAETGEPAWTGGNDSVGYSSPTLMTLHGTPQIVIFNGSSVASHDPADGRILWSVEWAADHPHVAQPRPVGQNRVLVSSGYGHGAKLFQIAKTGEGEEAQWSAEELWASLRLKAKFAHFVEHEGRIYGLDDGILVCIDPETGDRCWKRGRYGHGQILLVEDLLLVQTEAGELKLIEADPEEHRELGSVQVLGGKSWNTLTLSGNRLLLRNADEAVCYELPTVS